jgi:hypothetical protein
MYFVAKPNEEAKSFIQAAGLTDETQCRAIGTLVNDLKNYSLWDKMKAIYPMVGQAGVSSSFEFNLKNPSTFRGTFYGGWTFASTGATPNGTNGYMDTKLNPNVSLTSGNTHLSFYSRTNQYPYSGANSQMLLGAAVSPTYLPLITLSLNGTGTGANNFELNMNDYNTGSLLVPNTDTRGFILGNRPASNVLNMFRDGTKIGSNTATTSYSLPNVNMYLCGLSLSNFLPSNFACSAQCAFASIGDGLTDTEAANLYTAVQRFQTTLGRQV